MRLWRIVLFALAGCGWSGGGDPFGDGSCGSHDDCSGDERCVGPNEPSVCGIPPMEGCASSTDCGTDMVCSAVFDSCSPDGLGSECQAPCDGAYGGCGAGLDCVDSACVPALCASNTDCPTHQACDPAVVDPTVAVHQLSGGCVDLTCGANDDCDTEACVNGICQDAGGSCTEPIAVP